MNGLGVGLQVRGGERTDVMCQGLGRCFSAWVAKKGRTLPSLCVCVPDLTLVEMYALGFERRDVQAFTWTSRM